jgi:hypothetical protein
MGEVSLSDPLGWAYSQITGLTRLDDKKVFYLFVKQAEMNTENVRLQEQLEQERRDHELALRLAAENNSSVDDIQVTLMIRADKLVHFRPRKS